MSVRLSGLLLAAAATALAFSTAARAESPPIKSGLWEVTPDAADAAKMAKARQSMESMTPEMRAKIEAMMKEHGVDLSNGAPRFCISKESMSNDDWMNQGHCKTQFSTRTSSLWKWHSVCDQPAAEIDGEAVFASTENYTATVTSKTTAGTRTHVVKMAWKGSNCGDVKPVNTSQH